MTRRKMLAVLCGLVTIATLGMAQVTVVGTGTFPTDVNNVQAAVLVPGATVHLKGTFDFGNPDDPEARGQVVLSAPGVALVGYPGATIRGGYFTLTTLAVPGGAATAKNLAIRNIRFEGWGGFAICHLGVQDEDNVTRIEGNTFVNSRWPATDGCGIEYGAGGGRAIIRKNTIVGISMLAISVHGLTLHKDDFLIIEGNEIVDAHYDPVAVDLWDPNEGDPDNGPVIIRNNRIGISSDMINPFIWPIDLGYWYGSGVSNVLVEGNVLSGTVCDGIVAWSYGHGRKIVNNDLSRLTTIESHIMTSGRRDLIAGNKLGPVDQSLVYGNAFATGIVLYAQNAVPWGFPGPEPEAVTGNTVMFNDFRLTGLPGWTLGGTYGLATMGCVLLLSCVDMPFGIGYWPGCEVTGNLIMELGRFPAGTGGSGAQVLEFPIYAHDNTIFGRGWGAPAAPSANPGMGQALRSAAAARTRALENKRIAIDKLKIGLRRR